MTMQTIDNSKRGCGTLKKGGFYAQGKSRPGGLLKDWVWLLGTGLMSDACTPRQPIITCPPRQMMAFNLLGSLMTGQRLQNYPEEQIGWFNAHPGIPAKALLDHVGSVHYPNPAEFAAEVVAHGPSRKIPQSLARTLAKHTPLPIVFTHSEIPMAADDSERCMIAQQAVDILPEYFSADEVGFTPSWRQRGFGLTAHDSQDWANDHWQRLGMVAKLTGDLQTTETIFGVSWITNTIYIAKDDDNPDYLSNLFADGIEPVQIEE